MEAVAVGVFLAIIYYAIFGSGREAPSPPKSRPTYSPWEPRPEDVKNPNPPKVISPPARPAPRARSAEEDYLHDHGGYWHSHVHAAPHIHPDPGNTDHVLVSPPPLSIYERRGTDMSSSPYKVLVDRATFETLLNLAQRAEKFTTVERFAVDDAEDLLRQETLADHPQESPSSGDGYYQPTLFDPTPYEV
jgi:hypothetical protein